MKTVHKITREAHRFMIWRALNAAPSGELSRTDLVRVTGLRYHQVHYALRTSNSLRARVLPDSVNNMHRIEPEVPNLIEAWV